MTKICTKCNEDRLITEFHKHKNMSDGLQPVCISCRKQINAAYYVATPQHDKARKNSRVRKDQIISDHVKPFFEAGCADCFKTFAAESMDFDHVIGDKVMNISAIGALPMSEVIDVLENELPKCEVVCANCHCIRTMNRYLNSARRDYYDGILGSKLLTAKSLFAYDYMSSYGCIDCKETDIRVLELDHVRGQKIANVSYMIGKSRNFNLEDVKLEIAKCEVVCVNCHRVRSRSRKKSLSVNRGIKLTAESKNCSCGNKISTVAAFACLACSSKGKSDLYIHLTTEEMVANVSLIGMKPYATVLGLSDNGLRKVLKRRGVSMPLKKKRKDE